MGKGKRNRKRRKASEKKAPPKIKWYSIVMQHLKKHWGVYTTILSLGLGIASFTYYKLDKRKNALSGQI